MKKLIFIKTILFICLSVFSDFSTTNHFHISDLDKILEFRNKFTSTNQLLKILLIGDSYARAYNSSTHSFLIKLDSIKGISGVGLNNYRNNLLKEFGNTISSNNVKAFNFPNTANNPGNMFPWSYYEIPSGTNNIIKFFKQYDVGFYCDELIAYWIKNPNGSLFKLQYRLKSNNNWGPWNDLDILNGYSQSNKVSVKNFSLDPGYYEIRYKGQQHQGTNYVIGITYYDSNGAGIVPINISCGGWDARNFYGSNMLSKESYDTLFEALAPDLIILIDAGPPEETTYKDYISDSNLESSINSLSKPVYIIGSYSRQDGGEVLASFLQKQLAISNNWTYIDTKDYSENINFMLENNYLSGTDIHLTSLGSDWLGEYLFQFIISDFDKDGLSDGYENNTLFTSAFNSDSDNDGLSDSDEFSIFGTNPIEFDSDDDGFNDGDEVSFGLSPLDSNSNIFNAVKLKMKDLRVGSKTFVVSNGNAKIRMFVDEYSDLTSTWSNTPHVLEFDIPADTDTKFFRFRMD
ncbi:MAG: hypothetical protein VXX25_00005 [Verrucomicrobiota bacterium]|nr:hypothetical protein [Verrucomicrobiota bacterium]